MADTAERVFESMPEKSLTCDPAAIELLFTDRISEDERAALEAHLDGCADCRALLERYAAEPRLWSEARDFLSSADDVRDLAQTYHCRLIVLTPSDGAWSNDPFAASPLFHLVEMKPERWKIYRAKDTEP